MMRHFSIISALVVWEASGVQLQGNLQSGGICDCGQEGQQPNSNELLGAVNDGDDYSVKSMISNGTHPVDTLFSDGSTILHYYAGAGDKNMVKSILKAARQDEYLDFHSFINHRSKFGNTAMMEAAMRDRLSIVKYLTQLGGGPVNVILKEDDQNLLHIFAEDGNDKMISNILATTREDDSIDFDEFINHQNKVGNPPVNVAVEMCHVSVVKVLTKNGADLTISDTTDRGVLHHVVMPIGSFHGSKSLLFDKF